MSASLLASALNAKSEQFYVGQPALMRAITCSKSGDHRYISEIIKQLKTCPDMSLSKAFPKEVYELLKTASKITDPQIQEALSANQRPGMLLIKFAEIFTSVSPKRSFSVSDGNGGEVRVNSTAVRLFFPELMIAAKNFFKASAVSSAPSEAPAGRPLERQAKRPRVAEKEPQKADSVLKPKYEITKDFFPFLEANALKALLERCGGPKPAQLSMREALQALAAAKLVESQDPNSKKIVSEDSFRKVCDFFTHQIQDQPCALPNDGLALLAYVIASSKALTDGDQGQDVPPGLIDTGSEEMNGLLASFACLTKSQVDALLSHYKKAVLSPERMVDLCQNGIFFAAISQCKELRHITVVKRTSDEANCTLMLQNERLASLSWEIREITREGIRSSEETKLWEPAK